MCLTKRNTDKFSRIKVKERTFPFKRMLGEEYMIIQKVCIDFVRWE
jgi:hypothetical protein